MVKEIIHSYEDYFDTLNLYDILMSDDIVESIRVNTDLIFDYIPELRFEFNFDQKHPHHHLKLWDHTLYALSMSPKDFEVRLALLFHDISKPFVFEEGDVRHYYGHAVASAHIAEMILKRLGYDRDLIDKISYLVYYHDTGISSVMVSKKNEMLDKLYEVQKCDALAHHPDHLEKRIKYLEKTKKMLEKK